MYQWSAKHSAFFRTADVDMNLYPDWDLSDLRPATDDEFTRFTSPSPAGKVLGTNPDGNPYWADLPPLTQEQLIGAATEERQQRIMSAQQIIRNWETKLQLGRITDDEKRQLNLWLDYIDALNALDLSTAPDISWPSQPV
ncbi:tail fiber assembly protein [Shigella sonnei]|nr:tail fiber assembly protein [Shigella sonnei]